MTSSNRSNKPIGLIGAGVMGQCMIRSLREQGKDVLVYDLNPNIQSLIDELGARRVESPKQLAEQVDIALLSLPGAQHCREAILGEAGLIHSDHPVIIVNTSTIEPEASRTFAASLPAGWHYLDAPILGRPSALGKWLMPIGGEVRIIEQAQPVLEVFGKAVPVGEIGSGNILKALNQLMFTVINAVTSEVLAIAEASGLSKEVFYETVASSAAGTVSGLFKEVGRNIVESNFDQPVFTVDLLIKDTSLGLAIARQLGKPMMIAELVQMNNKYARAKGYGSLDTSALYKVFNE